MPIEWSKKLETGIAIIDSQHRVLISLINQLSVANTETDQRLRQTVIKLDLEHLVEYTSYHFLTEEKILEIYQSEELAKHSASHAVLKNKVLEIVNQYNSGEDILDALLVFLKYWLQSHILTTDMESFSAIRNHHNK